MSKSSYSSSYFPPQGQESGIIEDDVVVEKTSLPRYSETPSSSYTPQPRSSPTQSSSSFSNYAARSEKVGYADGYDSQESEEEYHENQMKNTVQRDTGRTSRNRSPPSLYKPIVIPQMTRSVDLSFSRAYSPALQSYGISASEFIQFVDKLNTVYTSSISPRPNYAPERGVGRIFSAAEQIFGLGANSAGGDIQLFLNNANAEIFNPRRLKVMLCSTSDLYYVLNLPQDEVMILSSLVEYSQNQNMTDNNVSLSSYISPLTFDVPPPNNNVSVLSRISQVHEDHRARSFDRRNYSRPDNRGILSRLSQVHDDYQTRRTGGRNTASGDVSILSRLSQVYDDRQSRKNDKEIYKANRKAEKHFNEYSREQEKEMYKLERHMNEANRKSEREISRAFRCNPSRNFEVAQAINQQEMEMYRMQNEMMRLQVQSRGRESYGGLNGYDNRFDSGLNRYDSGLNGYNNLQDRSFLQDRNFQDLEWLVIVNL